MQGLAYIPAAKPKLPGHEESYRPPPEYLPSEEERNAMQARPCGAAARSSGERGGVGRRGGGATEASLSHSAHPLALWRVPSPPGPSLLPPSL